MPGPKSPTYAGVGMSIAMTPAQRQSLDASIAKQKKDTQAYDSKKKEEEKNELKKEILSGLQSGMSVTTLVNMAANLERKNLILKVLLDNNFPAKQIFDGGFTMTDIVNVLTSRGKTPAEIAAKKTQILKQLISSKYPTGYTTNDILQLLISLKYTPEQVFNSGYEITYGEIKLNLDKFKLDSTQKAAFTTWENSIEGSDKCVKQGMFGLVGSKSTCFIESATGKYSSKKGGRRKRSVRRQYRRSRKVSRK
jgi:hypothetical protein